VFVIATFPHTFVLTIEKYALPLLVAIYREVGVWKTMKLDDALSVGRKMWKNMKTALKPAPKEPIPEPDYHEYYLLVRIVAGLIFYSFLIFVLIRSCDS